MNPFALPTTLSTTSRTSLKKVFNSTQHACLPYYNKLKKFLNCQSKSISSTHRGPSLWRCKQIYRDGPPKFWVGITMGRGGDSFHLPRPHTIISYTYPLHTQTQWRWEIESHPRPQRVWVSPQLTLGIGQARLDFVRPESGLRYKI